MNRTQTDPDQALLEPEKSRVKPPPMFRVVLLNDDYTPMDFVVQVLQRFFYMNREKATHIMLQVHRSGKGICGTYSKEVAQAKVTQVCAFAKTHQHPLVCDMEEA